MYFNVQDDTFLLDTPHHRPPESFFKNQLHPLLAQQTSLLRWLVVHMAKIIFKKPIDWDEQNDISPREAAMHAWFDGIEAITQSLWQPAFLGMFVYDVYNYIQNPTNRYQMTLKNLLVGLPENYDYQNSALSINLGGDIASIHRLEYWPWAMVLAGGVVSGFLFQYISRGKNTLYLEKIAEKSSRNLLIKIWQDGVLGLPYISAEYWRLYRSQQILIQKDYSIQQKLGGSEPLSKEIKSSYISFSSGSPQFKRILNRTANYNFNIETLDELENILQTIAYQSYFVKATAIAQLAQIAHHRRNDQLGVAAFLELQKAAKNNLYVRYKLWSIGGSKSGVDHLVGYLLISPVRLYIKLRFWALIVTKLMRLTEFLLSQQQCLTETKGVWTYTAAVGNYACLPCELDYVAYKPNLTGQDCVDGLLSLPRTPQQIIQSLSALQQQGPFATIDLHRQNWTNWTRDEWQNLLALFNSTAFSQASRLNLSRDIPSISAVEPDFLAVLADYLPYSNVQYFDLSGQIISAQGMLALEPGFRNNSRLISIGLAQSQINDAIFDPLVSLMAGMTSLRSLNVSSNQLTGFALDMLSEIWNANLSLTSLDISNNLLTSADIDRFQINATSLQTLDISGTALGNGTLNAFCAALANSTLVSLIMNYCRLNSPQAAMLFSCIVLANISRVSWAGNNIDYSGIQTIAELLPVSRMIDLDLNDNDINDDAIALLASALSAPNSSLARLSLSGNPFSGAGFIAFAAALNFSSLQELSLSGLLLNDDSVTALTAIPASNLPLTRLDLSNTGLSNTGAAELLWYLANSSLLDLDISYNFLLGNLGGPLLAIFHSNLMRLNLRNTYVDETDMQLALGALPDSKLEYLDISGNNLGDKVAITFAKQLLEPVSNQEKYLEQVSSDVDFERALTRSSRNTAIKKVDWEFDNQLTELGAASICRVWPFAGNDNDNLTLSGPNLNPLATGVHGCPYVVSQTSSAQPSVVASGLLTGGLILLALQPNLFHSSWRMFKVLAGTSLAATFGVSRIVVRLGKKLSFFSSSGGPPQQLDQRSIMPNRSR